MEIDYLTNSKAGAYMHCPYRFKLQFIEKLDVPMNHILAKGVSVHLVYHRFFSDIRDKGLLITNPAEQFKKIIRWIPEFQIEIQNFVDYEIKRWNELKDKSRFIPAILERKVINRSEFYGGTPDRIDLDDDNEYTLCDYKTGKVRELNHYYPQLSGYVFLINCSKVLGKPIKRVRIFWVTQNQFKQVNLDIFYNEDKFRVYVNTLLAKIRADTKPQAKPGPLCVFCDYKRFCPACRHALAKYSHIAEKYGLE